jgi:hypothetical protein
VLGASRIILASPGRVKANAGGQKNDECGMMNDELKTVRGQLSVVSCSRQSLATRVLVTKTTDN